MIIELPRMIQPGYMAPHGEPYNNMGEMIFSYIHSKDMAPLYVRSSLIGHVGDKEVIGRLKDYISGKIIVDIENADAMKFVKENRDIVVARVVSICTNSNLEYGVRVEAIKRIELDINPDIGEQNE